MIQDGKRARVIGCRQAETQTPIPAKTQKPVESGFRKGEQDIREVKTAVFAEQSVRKVKRVDVTVLSSLSELKTFQTKEAKTYAPEQTEVCSRSEEVQLQFMNCKNVQKDITLNKLFHTCQH